MSRLPDFAIRHKTIVVTVEIAGRSRLTSTLPRRPFAKTAPRRMLPDGKRAAPYEKSACDRPTRRKLASATRSPGFFGLP